MTQDFNEKVKVMTDVYRFQPFPGRSVEQMPVLLRSDPARTPVTVYRVLERRTSKSGNPDRAVFIDNCFTTGDQFIMDPSGSGEVKALNYEHEVAQALAKELKSVSQLVDWSFPVGNDLYQSLQGDHVYVFPASVVTRLRNNPYDCVKEREAFWEFAVRGEISVFQDNLKLQQERGKSIENSMGVYVPDAKGMRLVWVGSVGGNGSASSSNDLNGNSGRLLGELAPEVLEAQKKTQQTGNIETLLGKGTDVGNGLVVIKRDQITEEEYLSLTRKQ